MTTADDVVRLGDIRSVASIQLHVELTGGGTTRASGFFVEDEGRVYVVTNWHVLSGRDYRTGQCLDPNGATPLSVSFSYHSPDGDRLEAAEAELPLIDKDGEAAWLQHPQHGQAFDVAALDVTQAVAAAAPVCVPDWAKPTPHPLRPGEEVFAVGFPLGLSLTQGAAIWKRGSIATEPAIPIDGMHKFLVDSATREGMSGSPVYVWKEYSERKTPRMGFSLTDSGYFLAGIYSGRYGAPSAGDVESVIFKAQLGVVFSLPGVVETIRNGVAGTFSVPAQERVSEKADNE